MHSDIIELLPLLHSRGFRARRWRLPWSRTWTFIDERRNRIAFEQVGDRWRIRRFRHARGLNCVAVERDAWEIPEHQLFDAVKQIVPVIPWQVRLPDIARRVNSAELAQPS